MGAETVEFAEAAASRSSSRLECSSASSISSSLGYQHFEIPDFEVLHLFCLDQSAPFLALALSLLR